MSGADFGDWSDIGGSGADTIEHTVTGLTNGIAYGFELRAVNASGDGDTSSVGATPIAVPNAPENLRATPGDGQVALAWAAPSDRSITKYQVRSKVRNSNDNTYTDWANIPVTDPNAPPTGYIVTGLTNGTEYTFAVRAVNVPGNGPASTVTARPIAPPAAPAISSVGPGYRKVELAWEDPNDSTITGYQVSTDGGDNFAEISKSNAGTTTHTVAGLQNGIEYALAVRAMNVAGEGDASAANATPFNNPPMGSDKKVSTNENKPYVFRMKDFVYSDDEEDTLHHVKITSLPVDNDGNARGTLSLNGAAITSVTPPPQVRLADLEADEFLYTPPENAQGNAFATFEFKVSDGESDSAAYTMTINVVRVYSVRFGAAAYEADERGGEVTVEVTLSPSAAAELKIPIIVAADTAEAEDYTVAGLDPSTAPNVTGMLTFDVNGANTKTFTITVVDEDANKKDFDDETVTLSFGTLPLDVTKGEPYTATLTIIDDEGAVVRARFRRLNNEILSKHALTIADVTIAAVTSRQEAGPTCADQATTGSLGGQSSLAEILTSNAQTLTTGSLNLKQLLGTSSFRLRLTEDGSGAGPGCLTLWGQGDYRNLSSSDAQGLEWDGDLVTGQVGADALLQPDLRAGLAVSWSEGDFDYTDRTEGEPFSGDYTSRMMSVHPYLTWWSPAGLDVWATGGYGQGEIEIKDEEAGTHTSDTTLRLASVGASGLLPIGDALIAGGTTTLRVKAQASVAQMKVEGNGSLLEEQTIEAQRLRLALEGSHERTLASGGSLTPSFEVGLRHDGGDGATGTGLELGGGLRYVAPALGLTVEGRGRVLAAYEEAYEEWGASGLIRLDPGIDRQGLSLSLVPSYGQTASGVQRLWDQGLTQGSPQGPSATQAPTGRLEAEVGYGLVAFAGQGLVTPYGAVMLGGGTQQYRVGSRLELGPALRLSLEGTRQVTTVGQADQGIRLQVDWRF